MKVCKYTKWANGYGWVGEVCKSCIMAVALRKQIHMLDLHKLKNDGKLTETELGAIRSFDHETGTKEDLNILKILADSYKIKLEHVK